MDLLKVIPQWLSNIQTTNPQWSSLWRLYIQGVSLRSIIAERLILGEKNEDIHRLNQDLLQGEQDLRSHFLSLEPEEINTLQINQRIKLARDKLENLHVDTDEKDYEASCDLICIVHELRFC